MDAIFNRGHPSSSSLFCLFGMKSLLLSLTRRVVVVLLLCLLGLWQTSAWAPSSRSYNVQRRPASVLGVVGNAYLNALEEQTKSTMAASISAIPQKEQSVTVALPKRTPATASGASVNAHATSVVVDTSTKQVGNTASQIDAAVDDSTTNTTNNFPWKMDNDDPKALLQKIKDAGVAGIISFAAVQLGFWSLSVVLVVAAYVQVSGHWPDWTNPEEVSQLGAEAFAYVNIARLLAPLRIALALGSTSWIQDNVVDRFRGRRDHKDQTQLANANDANTERR